MPEQWNTHSEQWEVVCRTLPQGWQDKARELKAMRRQRGVIQEPETLLRILMIHLLDGCSLRETATRAAHGGLAEVSDVALLKRLRACGEWFRWIGTELMGQHISAPGALEMLPGRNLRLVDGSSVSEPGATGSTWRIHYAFALPSLRCDEVHVSDTTVGESLKRFRVEPQDVMMADRGYAHREGIAHVVRAGGDVVVRLNLSNVPLEQTNGKALNILRRLRSLREGECGDWQGWMRVSSRADAARIKVRLCAIRKSAQARRKAQEKILAETARKHREVQPETLEMAGYVLLLTTLAVPITASCILNLYRGRWQIELAFKRLKSLIGVGHLKKIDPGGAAAWLQGKLMVALLIETLLAAAERFSPWGYPLQDVALPMARDLADAAPA
jgi:Transposase DDE domain